MRWIKSLHVVVVPNWLAGPLDLPRIFVSLAMMSTQSVVESKRPQLLVKPF
jgi:uncharacterized membrane protein